MESSGKASRRARRLRPSIDSLEGRMMLSGSTALDVAMLSASTVDSRQVVVEYEVHGGSNRPIDVRIYRSGDAKFDPSDRLVAQARISGAAGRHRVELPADLGIDPAHPYVLVVADPDGRLGQADRSNDAAAFRKYSLAVTVHGGFQETVNDRIPAWQNRLDRALEGQGYDATLPFNWVHASRSPGAVRFQGYRLAEKLREAVEELPEGVPVDLHLIGHSQGAVVSSLALARLDPEAEPGLAGGFVRHTMLDPHAASNAFPARQYSTKPSFMGGIARMLVNDYQSRAKDPVPFRAEIVDEAEVIYQHTYFAMAQGTDRDSRYMNLWGQVPIKGEAKYTNITGPGISHSGDFSVVDWYVANVVPTLGGGRPREAGPLLTAGLDPRDGSTVETPARNGRGAPRRESTTTTAMPRFGGTTWPGAEVTITGAPIGTDEPITLGRTTAGADGRWTVKTRALPAGQYRLFAIGSVPASPDHPRVRATPRVVLGTVEVPAARR